MTLQNPKAFTNLSTAQLDAFDPLPIFQIGTTGSDHLYKSNQNSSLPGRLYIANGNLFGVPYNYAGSANPQLSNVECALWVCVETYRTTTNSTKQHQAVVSTYDQFFADSSYETNYHAIVPDVSSVGGQADFTIDQDSVYGLGSYLDNLFNDTVEYGWNRGPGYTTDVMKSLWNGSTVDPQAFIDNLAASMTNSMRLYNISSRPALNGTAFQLAIVIRWEWLVLPVALVFL